MKKGGLFYFAVFQLVISLFSVLNGLSNMLILINAILGIIGAVLVFCDRKEGFFVSLAWAILQIPIAQIVDLSSGSSFLFNMQQVFTLYFSFYVTNGGMKYLLGINLIGLIFTLLLLTIRRSQNKSNKKKKK